MTGVRLTKNDIEILEHRLSIPDAIEECFRDTDGLERIAPHVGEAVAMLEGCLKRKYIPHGLKEAEREVLAELIEGSTWCAVHEGAINVEITERQFDVQVRKFEKLAKKLRSLIGREFDRIPTC